MERFETRVDIDVGDGTVAVTVTVVVVVVGGTVVVVVAGTVVVVVVAGTVVVVVVVGTVVVVVVGTVVVVVVVGTVVVVVVVGTVVVVVGTVVVVVGTVVVVVVLAQEGTLIVLSSKVTAPLRARTRPVTDAPVSSVAEVRAMMVPTKSVVSVPRVAELPTCQNTLHACTPPVNRTDAGPVDPVVRVLPAWNTNTELAFPVRVSGPLSVMELDAV
jgi:hypothetical protein